MVTSTPLDSLCHPAEQQTDGIRWSWILCPSVSDLKISVVLVLEGRNHKLRGQVISPPSAPANPIPHTDYALLPPQPLPLGAHTA